MRKTHPGAVRLQRDLPSEGGAVQNSARDRLVKQGSADLAIIRELVPVARTELFGKRGGIPAILRMGAVRFVVDEGQ